ncbi:DUF397 domain-containing protein [Streptomyces sp. ISL-96]|uniref:DUF397 domain-containing protein n=1 Tax=Streptomyces sp. ISL-96 TaxID=2819191 RepID=UPI001BE75DCA|nr:DUF397 domain-containing protein [Streptomyces sp. ISL-96]MBT2487489.1 DUF397 domain-containing protein [Streptomyces sp. ISL-96]
MPELKWLKSSFSEASGNACVEVATTGPDGVALRESDSPATIVSTGRATLRALVLGVKTGAVKRSQV